MKLASVDAARGCLCREKYLKKLQEIACAVKCVCSARKRLCLEKCFRREKCMPIR